MTLTATERISPAQEKAWGDILGRYSESVCESVVKEIGLKSSGMPDFNDFEKQCKSKSKGGNSGPPRPVSNWWGPDGQWGGDWVGVPAARMIEVYAQMAKDPWAWNRKRVGEFRDLCQSRGILSQTLTAAYEALQKGDGHLAEYLRTFEAKAA